MKKIRLIDLSLPLMNANEEEKGFPTSNLQPKIKYETHIETAHQFTDYLGCNKDLVPLGNAWETLELVAHAGTHVDAPFHFYPTTENGTKAAYTVDEIPLEWFYQNGVVLDLRHIPSGMQATVDDIQEALKKISYKIQPLDIVCLWFGKDKEHGKASYWESYPGITAGVVHYLVDQGVKVIATDSLGQDHPFIKMKEKFDKTGDIDVVWEAHRVGKEKEFCNIEKMANLEQLPPFGFKIACFPIPIKGASGGWCRPIAIIEEEV